MLDGQGMAASIPGRSTQYFFWLGSESYNFATEMVLCQAVILRTPCGFSVYKNATRCWGHYKPCC